MPRVGNFGGFEFDEEVFSSMMQEADFWSNPILASGVVREDQTIMNLIGDHGNVATIPFYKPLSVFDSGMDALNNDGQTDNTPVQVSGGKQTCMLIQRMKAFKAQDFTKELTGADPMTNIKSKIQNYYTQVWEKELMNIVDAVLGVTALKSHIYDITADGDGLIQDTSLIDAEQTALGDKAEGLGLLVMNSKIYAKYKKLGMVDYDKYTVGNVIQTEVTLPRIGGKIPLVTDYYTSETTGTSDAKKTVYNTYLLGEGAFLSCDKTNYENQYTTNYDPETSAGVEKFYTKQGKVLHPNGLSLEVDNIAKESPDFAELGKSANYSLKFNAKNVKIGVMKSLG